MNNIYDLMTNNVNGATFISIDTSTTPKLKGGKKNPFKDRVRKIMENANVMVFQNKTKNGYNEMVRRRLLKEGKHPDSFQLSPRVWGVRIPNTPFVEHNGQYYLEVIFLRSGEVTFTVGGVPTDPSTIEGLDRDTKDHNMWSQGGLNDKVIIRTFKIDSITKITINGKTYTNLYFQK